MLKSILRYKAALMVLMILFLWLPWLMFAPLVAIQQWHWWSPDWPPSLMRRLTEALFGCAVGIALLCVAVAALVLYLPVGRPPSETARQAAALYGLNATLLLLIAIWAASVLAGAPSVWALWLLLVGLVWQMWLGIKPSIQRTADLARWRRRHSG